MYLQLSAISRQRSIKNKRLLNNEFVFQAVQKRLDAGMSVL